MADSSAQGAVPHLIKFSGALQNLTGEPIAGPVDVTFALYSQQAGGSPLWFETQTVQANPLGHYTVLLGAMTPTGVPMELFTAGEARWLGVQVSNLPEQSRVLLVSVPYAMKAGDAETLGGKPASAFVLSTTGSETDTSTSTNTTLTGLITSGSTSTTTNSTPITQATTQNYIPRFADNSGTLTDSAMFQSGNNIGINTNAPAFGLDLNSNVFAVGTKSAAPGAGGTMRLRDDTGTVRWLFGMPGSAGSQDFFMYNYTNGHAPLFIENGAPSYSFYFSGNGNVGVGTNSPTFPFDVAKSIMAIGPKTASAGVGGAMRFRNDTGTVQWSLGIPNVVSATDFFLYNNVSGQSPFYIHSDAPSNTLVLESSGDISAAGTIQAGFFDGDGSQLTNISLKSGGFYDISVSTASFADGADTAQHANGADTFDGFTSDEFPKLVASNTFSGTQAITGGGKLGVGTLSPGVAIDVVGDIRASGCFLAGAVTVGGTCSSDVRFKTNVRPFASVLDKVAELQPVRFNWRVKEFPDYHFSPGESFGLIAQRVEKVFPDMVSTDKNGYRKVNYSELPFLLLESVRELKSRNDSLRAQVQGQQQQIQQAHATLAQLGKANAQKDTEIEALNREVELLRKAQRKMAAIEARLARVEAQRDTRTSLAHAVREEKKHDDEIARTKF